MSNQFLGHLFNWALFGALTVQVCESECAVTSGRNLSDIPTDLYYIAFPKDKPLPKAIVGTVYTLEILQIVLSTRDAFRNFGTGWGSMSDLDSVGWLWFSVPVLGSLSASRGTHLTN